MKEQKKASPLNVPESGPEDITDAAAAYLRQKIQLFCENKGVKVEPGDLSDELNLYESGLLDSFDLFAFLTTIERELNIELDISEREPGSFTSIGGLARLIDESRIL